MAKIGLESGAGRSERLGATVQDGGVNFAVASRTAETIWVCLFARDGNETHRFALQRGADAVFSGFVSGIGAGQPYGLRADGEYAPEQGAWFDPNKLLVDPYARQLDRPFALDPALMLPRPEAVDTAKLVPKGIVTAPLGDPVRDAGRMPELVYEVNVRGFSMRRADVPEAERGTVAALSLPQLVAHFKKIGADTVELMPVAAWIDDRHLLGSGLTNAWGYNPVAFMAPDPRLVPGGPAELRRVCDALRTEGIQVVLDLVFNHSGEGDAQGPTLSMRGLDNLTYYRHADTPDLPLINDAGTGNTLACDQPQVQRLVMDALRFWAGECGVAGFRFDLATILGRSMRGFSADAPLLQAMRADPLISERVLVAEPWDVGPGGYQVGQFGAPFYEWNDKYRDDVRRFWRGDAGTGGAFATRLAGSSDMFDAGRGPRTSVNFIAAHDGFTLSDLVSYEHKHNEANGEGNRDGHNENLSWNGGVEGDTLDPTVLARRDADRRALLATLFLSLGTPMLTAGDEFARTQKGNNNAYAQDNDLTWIDWRGRDLALEDFVAELSALRASIAPLTANAFLSGEADARFQRDAVWLGAEGEIHPADWSGSMPVLGMWLHEGGMHWLIWYNRGENLTKVLLPGLSEANWTVRLASSGTASLYGNNAGLPGRSVSVLVSEVNSQGQQA